MREGERGEGEEEGGGEGEEKVLCLLFTFCTGF